MEKIKLEICCGTTCYLLGAARLLKSEAWAADRYRDRLEITALPCLGLCSSEKIGGAPFVRLNGAIHSRATEESIVRALDELLGENG